MNLSNMRMFAEMKCSFVEPFDNLGQVIDLEAQKLELRDINKDEFVVKPNDPSSPDYWEIKLSRLKKFVFTMNSCNNYEHFVEALEGIIKSFSRYLTPADIVAMGVQGDYLYPVSSLQEFSQLVFAWSDNYIADEYSQVEIYDLGVDVFFRKDGLKINITCKLVPKAELDKYFPAVDPGKVQEINLYINIQITSNQPLKMQKSISVSLSQAIKNHVYQATQLIEQRLDKLRSQQR
ncbi:MAG: hypothetical protein ACM3X9_14325 [Bacillota bacterium]